MALCGPALCNQLMQFCAQPSVPKRRNGRPVDTSRKLTSVHSQVDTMGEALASPSDVFVEVFLSIAPFPL